MQVEFTEHETATLIDLLAGAIETHPFPQSTHVQRLRGILGKIRPAPELPWMDPADTDQAQSSDTGFLGS